MTASTALAQSPPPRRRLLRDGAIVAGLVFGLYLALIAAPAMGSLAFDAVAYWSIDMARLYEGEHGGLGFFGYSPAAALVLLPLAGLPWPVFIVAWYGLLLAAAAWLGRRNVLLLLALPPVAIELYHANIHLLLAVAIVIGFRHPAAWAIVLLTKVTPGVGLLWFVARGEWRKLGVAVGATCSVAGMTMLLMPGQWFEWLALLASQAGGQPAWPAMPVPLWLRLPLAAALVWWGARRDAYWTVPAAATLALPALWPGGLAILAACLRVPAAGGGYDLPDARPAPPRRPQSGRRLAARLGRAARLQ